MTSDVAITSRESTKQSTASPLKLETQPSVLRIALLADAAHVNVQRWCEGLTRAGAEVHLLSFRHGEANGWKVYHLPVRNLPGKLHYLAGIPYVRRLIKGIRPHILVCYYITGYGTMGSLTGFRPIVQVTSGSDVLLAVRNAAINRVVRHNLSRADMVTAWAPHMAEAAEQLGTDRKKVVTLPRGIPFHRFARSRRTQPNNNDPVRIISTRSLRRDYNLSLLLQALKVLQEQGMRYSLTIAGEGPQRELLVSEARNLNLGDRVRFVGFVPNDELPCLLAKHDVYVSLIDSDGVSASLLEAMTVGLLPVVPQHPANEFWIKHLKTGLLLDDLSPTGVAGALKRAISDAALREQAWRENCGIVEEHADLYRNAETYIGCFRRLVGESMNLGNGVSVSDVT